MPGNSPLESGKIPSTNPVFSQSDNQFWEKCMTSVIYVTVLVEYWRHARRKRIRRSWEWFFVCFFLLTVNSVIQMWQLL